MITLYINVFLESIQLMTDVLQNLTNTSYVFSWELFTASQKELLRWYIYIQNGIILTFWCNKWHGACLTTCAKNHKNVWKSWKGNTPITVCVSLMECKFVTVLSITSNIFWETEVEILRLGCEKKAWFDKPM